MKVCGADPNENHEQDSWRGCYSVSVISHCWQISQKIGCFSYLAIPIPDRAKVWERNKSLSLCKERRGAKIRLNRHLKMCRRRTSSVKKANALSIPRDARRSLTVAVAAETKFMKDKDEVRITDVKVGDRVVIEAKLRRRRIAKEASNLVAHMVMLGRMDRTPTWHLQTLRIPKHDVTLHPAIFCKD